MRIETFWSESVDEALKPGSIDAAISASGAEDETQLIFQHSMPIEQY
jgi:hypothetical protein